MRGSGIYERETYTARAASHAKRLRREMTVSEKKLWEALRPLKLNIRRQAPIGRYIADFVHLGSRLVIEVDGARHDLPEEQSRDLERDAWLKSEGFRVLRVRDADAFGRPHDVAEQIRQTITLSPRGGEGRVRGVASEPGLEAQMASASNSALRQFSAATPPSPTLPPSRGKGE
ncbi:MAG: endonuclease domain-containing protein [Ignavibacteriales bacterium]